MTWTKFGSEFFDDCANHGLSDAAVRTHAEAIGWLYNIESVDLTINKHLVRRFAGSEYHDDGIRELLAVQFWRIHGDTYEVVHHADVIRQSLAAQHKKQERDKKAAREYRKRNGLSVSADVSAAVSGDADRQTNKQAVREAPPVEEQFPVAPVPPSLAASPTTRHDLEQTGVADDHLDGLFLPQRSA